MLAFHFFKKSPNELILLSLIRPWADVSMVSWMRGVCNSRPYTYSHDSNIIVREVMSFYSVTRTVHLKP
jgi:hypothetical protein